MKRVMCIDDAHWFPGGAPCPKFGEITTVSWEGVFHHKGIPAYEFVEYPPLPEHDFRYFSQKYFVVLSDVESVELVNNKETVNGIPDTSIRAV